jgi:DMSO/TMAO reductase YedYZ molybdopterin-dependent catalytic subunit
MRSLLVLLCSPLVFAAAMWTAMAACLDAPQDGATGVARLIVAWDPLACGVPHRVAIELADDEGASVSASTPCNLGGLAVDVPRYGVYRGRIYAWALAAPVRSEMAIEIDIDQTIVHRDIATPL